MSPSPDQIHGALALLTLRQRATLLAAADPRLSPPVRDRLCVGLPPALVEPLELGPLGLGPLGRAAAEALSVALACDGTAAGPDDVAAPGRTLYVRTLSAFATALVQDAELVCQREAEHAAALADACREHAAALAEAVRERDCARAYAFSRAAAFAEAQADRIEAKVPENAPATHPRRRKARAWRHLATRLHKEEQVADWVDEALTAGRDSAQATISQLTAQIEDLRRAFDELQEAAATSCETPAPDCPCAGCARVRE